MAAALTLRNAITFLRPGAIAMLTFVLVTESMGEGTTIAFFTGNKLLSHCNTPGQIDVCLGMVAGYSDMLSVTGEICTPKQVTINQTRDIVMKFLREHPEATHLAAASLAREALTNAFPCKSATPK